MNFGLHHPEMNDETSYDDRELHPDPSSLEAYDFYDRD